MSIRKNSLSIYKALALLMLVASILAALPHKAGAVVPPPPTRLFDKKTNFLMYDGKKGFFSCTPEELLYQDNWDSYKVLGAKSNASFVKVSHTDSFVSLTVSKPGKATISVTYTLDGKERTANYKAEFQRYSDIFRRVSVGGKIRKYNSNDYGYYGDILPPLAEVGASCSTALPG